VGISVVIPSYLRESVLVETVRAMSRQLTERDEIVVVDQTPAHEAATEEGLAELCRSGRVRWFRKARPSICEAMNVGALLASNEVVLFLDDDVVPSPGLLEVFRELFSRDEGLAAVNGQILQPWHAGPVAEVAGFGLDFDYAYSKAAEIPGLVTCNAAVRREAFLRAGGMDETYEGGAHRCDADLGYRLRAFTGRLARFEPRASVRHLQAGGGTRAHGFKDSWAAIDSAIGDYYFALRWLGRRGALRHALHRLRRAPFNRRTLRRPWLVPSILAREAVALFRAAARALRGPARTIRTLERYPDVEERRARAA
jgi:glycosyltransferase involved in cell wall biosynthesis